MGKIREEMEKVVRENAIKDLKELQIDIGSSPDDLENSPLYYALDIAIKALEQQPCEACISKQEVNELVDELARTISDERCCISRGRSTASIMQDIIDLPPVTPKGVTVTDFADRCRECGAEYGKMLEASKPKPGRWISHNEHCERLGVKPSGLGAYTWCSNCDCGIDVEEFHRNHYNFCPNCGADMRETRESKKNYILGEDNTNELNKN